MVVFIFNRYPFCFDFNGRGLMPPPVIYLILAISIINCVATQNYATMKKTSHH